MNHATTTRLASLLLTLALTSPGWGFASASGSGTIVCLNKAEATASILDRATGREIGRVATGEGPHEVAVSPDGRTAVVANYGQREPGSTLTVIDLRARTASRTIDLGDYHRPHGIVFHNDGRRVTVTAEQEQTLLTVDIRAGRVVQEVGTAQNVSHMVALSPDEQRAYVSSIGSGSVSVIDLEGGSLVKIIPTGTGAEGIDVSPAGNEVWVGNRGEDTISIIDTRTLEIVDTLKCPDFPIRLKFTPDGRHVLVSNARSGDVSVFDARTRRELRRVDMSSAADDGSDGDGLEQGPVPIGILVTPDGREAFIANTRDDLITVIDLETWTVARRLRAGREPDGLAFSPLVASTTTPSIAKRYRDAARRIQDATMAGNDSWMKLQELCDDIGPRLSGSPALDQAIDWSVEAMRADGHENVGAEKVMVPHWVRGEESLVMVEPRVASMAMLGLGGSVGTPPEGITAEVVVVANEAELEKLGPRATGKIVLFNNPMPPYDPEDGAGYGQTVTYRVNGARLAAKHGAVACLVRSVTAHSLRSPHTGGMRYGDAEKKIPAAAVSTEDASLMARFAKRNIPIKVTLSMEARTLEPAPSGNVVAELRGTTRPDEIVIISGHLDSWDTGTGAHDDGAPCVMAMEALNVLRRLGMTPRRTIRVVLWTNEENGLAGARAYAKDHADELANHVAAIEADSGAFRPVGYSIDGADDDRVEIAARQMEDLTSLFESIGATSVTKGHSGADVGPMKPAGVMLLGHRTEGSIYFDYHHTHADTVDKVDPTDLSRNVAVLATTAYILADMPERLGETAPR